MSSLASLQQVEGQSSFICCFQVSRVHSGEEWLVRKVSVTFKGYLLGLLRVCGLTPANLSDLIVQALWCLKHQQCSIKNLAVIKKSSRPVTRGLSGLGRDKKVYLISFVTKAICQHICEKSATGFAAFGDN